MAKAIYGSAVTSFSSAQNYLTTKLGDGSVKVLRKEWKDLYHKADVLLIPSVSDLQGKIMLKHCNDFAGVIIVFDSPINLCSIKKLQWLDISPSYSHVSYQFSPTNANYAAVIKSVKTAGKQKIVYKKKNVLNDLINERLDTQFLRLVHDFIYFCISHSNRELIKRKICKAIRENAKANEIYNDLKLYCNSDTDLKYLKEFTDYLKSNDGKLLVKAVYSTRKKKVVDYKEHAQDCGIDPRDLKWITKTIKTE